MMNNNNQIKRGSQQPKKASITEEIEKLKQRREDRKNKITSNDDKKEDKFDGIKLCDAYYENLMKKKKIQFSGEPESVRYKIIIKAYFK